MRVCVKSRFFNSICSHTNTQNVHIYIRFDIFSHKKILCFFQNKDQAQKPTCHLSAISAYSVGRPVSETNIHIWSGLCISCHTKMNFESLVLTQIPQIAFHIQLHFIYLMLNFQSLKPKFMHTVHSESEPFFCCTQKIVV